MALLRESLHVGRGSERAPRAPWIRLKATADTADTLFDKDFLQKERRALGEHALLGERAKCRARRHGTWACVARSYNSQVNGLACRPSGMPRYSRLHLLRKAETCCTSVTRKAMGPLQTFGYGSSSLRLQKTPAKPGRDITRCCKYPTT
jgi:hypothetical protein